MFLFIFVLLPLTTITLSSLLFCNSQKLQGGTFQIKEEQEKIPLHICLLIYFRVQSNLYICSNPSLSLLSPCPQHTYPSPSTPILTFKTFICIKTYFCSLLVFLFLCKIIINTFLYKQYVFCQFTEHK